MSRRRRLRQLLFRKRIVLVLLLILSGIFYRYLTTTVYPNTWISGIAVGGLTAPQVVETLNRSYAKPFELEVKDRVYRFTYDDMGVFLDTDQANAALFTPNREPFPKNLFRFMQAFIKSRAVPPPLVYSERFTTFLTHTVFDFSSSPDVIRINNDEKRLEVETNEDRHTIDEPSLKVQLMMTFGEQAIRLKPLTRKIPHTRVELAETTNQKLARAYREPVTIYLETGKGPKKWDLDIDSLKKLTSISYNPGTESVRIDVDTQAFRARMAGELKKYAISADKSVSLRRAKEELIALLTGRFDGKSEGNVLTLKTDDGPNTLGDTATKYIEVDISQQQMYLFENGNVVKTYRVSTGLFYQTPTGTFSILNKVPNAFSDIYNVWMPYWMAFGYSQENNAYFGIHELPYEVTDGKKISRPSRNIGQPSTGGCVALDIGDAKEVYDFAEVGTPLIISR